MQIQAPGTKCNFTRRPRTHKTQWLPEIHWSMAARVNTACSDIYLSLSAPAPFDTLPGFHTHLRHPLRNPVQHRHALGPSPTGSLSLSPSLTTPAGVSSQRPESLSEPRSLLAFEGTRPAGPRRRHRHTRSRSHRPSSGSKPFPILSASPCFPATCNYSPGTLSPNTNV